MRILITGAAGFVGIHLLTYLTEQSRGEEEPLELFAGVRNLQEQEILKNIRLESRDRLHVIQADITDEKAVNEMAAYAVPDYVIHLAAQSSVALSFQKPELTYAVNVDGTEYLLTALRRYSPDARILIVGSIDQYGNVPASCQPIPEMYPLTGESPYGQSKRRQEQLASDAWKIHGQKIIAVRSSPHIGTGQARTFAIADWAAQIREMQAGKRSHELVTGNLDVVRDITDVRDIINAYWLLLKKGIPGEIYNVGRGEGVRLSDIPPLLAEIAGITDLIIRQDPARLRPVDVPMLIPDVSRLKSHTGWEAKYRLEDTLRDVVTKPQLNCRILYVILKK